MPSNKTPTRGKTNNTNCQVIQPPKYAGGCFHFFLRITTRYIPPAMLGSSWTISQGQSFIKSLRRRLMSAPNRTLSLLGAKIKRDEQGFRNASE